MVSRAKAIETDNVLPTAVDVVIIGGGILGVCTAYFLAEQGISVALCEKGVVAGEASCRSIGQVASAGLGVPKLELVVESKRIWKELSEKIGDDIGYRRNGYIAPCVDSNQLADWEKWLSEAKLHEPEGHILSADETSNLVSTNGQWAGSYYNPTDGCAEPTLAAPVIANAARSLGATIIAQCAVRGVEFKTGRISAVVTEKGTMKTDTVVLAGGIWSTMFCRNMGIDLPTMPVDASCLKVGSVEQGPEGTGDAPGVSWRKEIDGSYTIGVIGGIVPILPASFRYGFRFLPAFRKLSHHWDLSVRLGKPFFSELAVPTNWSLDKPSPFEVNRIFAPEVSKVFIHRAEKLITALLPAFNGMRTLETWAGRLIATPDNMPTISPVSSKPGLHFLTGFSYGLTMGPAAAKLMTDLITGRTPDIDPTPYRYERYIDGTRLTVIP